MTHARRTFAALLTGLGLAGAGSAAERPAVMPVAAVEAPASAIPANLVDVVHPAYREAVARVLRQPTLSARGTSPDVACPLETYAWLLEHPDRVALAWKRLRVPVVEIGDAGNGRFVWTDEHGSEVVWQTVGRFPNGLVWYATGKVKPSTVLPTMPIRAVAVVSHPTRPGPAGADVIRPVAQVYLHTDNRAAGLILRMIGPTAPKLAEQGAESLLFFFNGIGGHVTRHPENLERLLGPAAR